MEISAGEHAVVVDAPEPLTAVADTAMRLWAQTDTPGPVRGYGFTDGHSELVFTDTPAEVDLDRTTTEGPDGQ